MSNLAYTEAENIYIDDRRGLQEIGMYHRHINRMGLSLAAKGLYLTLLDCPSEISQQQLCEMMDISKPTLIKYVGELERAKVLTVDRGEYNPEIGKYPTNIYILNPLPIEGRSKESLPGLRGGVKNLYNATTTYPEVSKTSLQDEALKSQLFTDYQNHFGAISSMIVDDIKADIQEYGVQSCLDAFKEAIQSKGHGFGWRYIQSILKRWKTEGKDSPKPAGKTIPFNSNHNSQYRTRTGDLSPNFPDGTPRTDHEGRTPDDPLFGLTIYT